MLKSHILNKRNSEYMKYTKKIALLLLISTIFALAFVPSCTSKSTNNEPVTPNGLLHSTQTPITDDAPKPHYSIYNTLNHDSVVGVWISYIELSGILTKKSEKQFRENYSKMMDNCVDLGINTVYVHLRPFGDALYKSEYYPWSKYVTGTVGKTPDFDPLEIMLEETHKRNISFHGWLNPMRIQHDADIAKVSENYLIGEWYADESKRGKYVVKHGNNWYLNPAYDEVTTLIGNGAMEITANYNVDGIHIDDYFYPTTETSFDIDAFNNSNFTNLKRFRTFNCNNMVRIMHDSAKQGNPNALFGISPSGNIEYNLEQLYADVEAWSRNIGYADYIAPQVYYGFNNSAQPYIECINSWQKLLDGSPIDLIIGLAVYKIGLEDSWAGDGSDEWIVENEIILRQIQEAKGLHNYKGIIFFSYNWLFSPSHVTDTIQNEIDAFKPIIY